MSTGQYDDAHKQVFDENGLPLYYTDSDVLQLSICNYEKNSYLEIATPSAIYRLDNGKWTLLNAKAANAKTDARFLRLGATGDNVDCKGLLGKEGSYKLEKQFGGELMSFPFTVKGTAPDISWGDGPASTSWSTLFEKEVYPIGTEAITVTTLTGNGVFYGSAHFGLFRFENQEWVCLYQQVPNTGGDTAYKPNITITDIANTKGYLDQAGKYKLHVYYSSEASTDLFFTVE